MTARAIVGLLVFNLFILGRRGPGCSGESAAGAGGRTSFDSSASRISSASARLMIVMTCELVLGIPIDPATILLSGVGLVVVGVVVGRASRVHGARPAPARLALPGDLGVRGVVRGRDRRLLRRLSSGPSAWRGSLVNGTAGRTGCRSRGSSTLSGRLEPEFLSLVRASFPGIPRGRRRSRPAPSTRWGRPTRSRCTSSTGSSRSASSVAVIGLLARRVHDAILFPLLLAFLVAPSLVDWISHGLRGPSAGLSRRSSGVAHHPVDRGREALAARSGDRAPLGGDADEA